MYREPLTCKESSNRFGGRKASLERQSQRLGKLVSTTQMATLSYAHSDLFL
jgi:hypothetical protein